MATDASIQGGRQIEKAGSSGRIDSGRIDRSYALVVAAVP
jgi:hypothetical protein